MMMYIHFALWIMFLADSTLSDNLDANHNVYCNLVSDVVAVKQDGLPYFVTLHRCHGSVRQHNPSKKQCVANASTEVNIKVMTDPPKFIKMVNHTDCTGKCVFDDNKCPKAKFNRDQNDCSCTCKYNTPQPCPEKRRWDSQICGCKCALQEIDAPLRTTLDSDQCKFVCKPTLNECARQGYSRDVNNRCICRPLQQAVKRVNEKSDQGALLPALLIGEFVVLYLIFDFLLYSKKTGFMYYVKTKCSRQRPDHRGVETERRQENGGDNTPLTVCVDQNGRSKLHVSSI